MHLHIGSRVLPNVLRETELAIEEAAGGSTEELMRCGKTLLETYTHPDNLRTFLTPLWTFKALMLLLQHSPDMTMVRSSQTYHMGLLMLDRSASQWPSCTKLLDLVTRASSPETSNTAING